MNQESIRGNELKLQREEMGLSREDVFRKLRIPLDIIQQIESGTMDPNPSLTYSAGFIKSYCAFLGICPEPYIAELLKARKAPQGIITQAIHGNAKNRPQWLHEAIMWATIIAIIVLGWVTYAVMFHPQPTDISNQVQADTVDIRTPRFPSR